MRADTNEPCDQCGEFLTVARICIIGGDGVARGELIDYADLCRDCLLDAATSAGLQVGDRIKKATPIPADKE